MTTLPATTTTIGTEDLIKQAVQDYIAGYFACGQQPASCDAAQFTASEGSSRTTVNELASGMVGAGLHFATDVRGSYLVAESIAASDTEATANYCAFDAVTVLGAEGPDGVATVVNDEILSYRYAYHLFLEGGKWRVGSQEQQQQLGEGNLCPPSE
ncbi:MAG TPA: hypothetical protein VGC84_17265 [Ilumatobacteraceae bacterium]